MPLVTVNDLYSQPPEEIRLRMEQAQKLSELYETHLAHGDDGPPRTGGIHASELSPCDRRVVYSLMNTERRSDITNDWKKRFLMGHAIHNMLQEQFYKMERRSGQTIEFRPEVEISPDKPEQFLAQKWNIHSHCDGVFTVREKSGGDVIFRCIIEIKSASPAEYEKLKGPKPEHIEQAHVYMACLDIPMVWFIYYNKGNQNYTGSDSNFFQTFNMDIWEGLEERFQKYHEYSSQGVLPPKTETMLCELCPWSWTCQPDYLSRRRPMHQNVPSGWKV